jgi:hypothetical protein
MRSLIHGRYQARKIKEALKNNYKRSTGRCISSGCILRNATGSR